MQNKAFPASQGAWLLRVFQLAWPIILSGLSVPLVGAVDTAVMGQLPDPRFMAAVAVGAMLFSSVFWVFGFLRMGTTGFVAQAYGQDNPEDISLAMWRALLLGLILGGLLIILQWPLGKLGLWLMGAEAEVTELAEVYFNVRVWSAPLAFINYVVLGTLIGLQRMRELLAVQLVLNISNMVLDGVFVLWLGMDVDGVALASVLSELLAAALGLYLLRSQLLIAWKMYCERQRLWLDQLLDAEVLQAMFQVNGDLFFRTLLLTTAFFIFTAQGAQFGTVVLAANAILMNMMHMIAYGLDGFAHAAEALVGEAYGAKRRRVFRQAIFSSTVMAILMAAGVSVLYLFIGEEIIRLLTGITEVAETADTYLIWVVISPILSVWSYQLDGIFVGMTQTKAMRNTVGLALLVYLAALWLALPVWGNHGLWGCLMGFMVLRGVFLGIVLSSLSAFPQTPVQTRP